MKKILLICFILTISTSNAEPKCTNVEYKSNGRYEITCDNYSLSVKFLNGKLCSFARIEILLIKGGKGGSLEISYHTPDGNLKKIPIEWSNWPLNNLAEYMFCFDSRDSSEGRGRISLALDKQEVINIEYSLKNEHVKFMHEEVKTIDVNLE